MSESKLTPLLKVKKIFKGKTFFNLSKNCFLFFSAYNEITKLKKNGHHKDRAQEF